MPPVVSPAQPTAVLPSNLCRAFQASDDWPGLRNDYPDGNAQRSALTTSQRRRWTIGVRLSASALATLRAFFDAHAHEPFLFYDFSDWPMFTYDATGATVKGRYSVRFEGGWRQSSGIAMTEADFALVEVAAVVPLAEYLWFDSAVSSAHIGMF